MYVCAHNPVLELNKNFNIRTKINGMYCVLISSANTHILSISRFLRVLSLQTSKQLLWSRKYNYCKLWSLLKYEMNSTLSLMTRDSSFIMSTTLIISGMSLCSLFMWKRFERMRQEEVSPSDYHALFTMQYVVRCLPTGLVRWNLLSGHIGYMLAL